MRALRYLLRVMALLVALQTVFALLVIHYAAPLTVDTNYSRKGIFQTDSKMAVYASPIVARASDKKQVVILGSSNTTMGLRPDKLQPYLGDVRIHNLSIGSEKFRGIGQLVDLLYRQTPPDQQRNYVFVIGLSYPLIADEPRERKNMRTTIDDEERRFGLFAPASSGSTPRVADRWLGTALEAAWPFLTPKALYNTLVRTLPESYWFGLAESVPFSAEKSNLVQYNEAQNQKRIAFYNSEIVDTTGAYTFDYLMRAVDRVTQAGGEVVIVDLPSAKWLQRSTALYPAYQKLRAPYIARLEKMPHVRYINAERGFADADFYDGIHPRNRIAGEIARQVGPTIAQALEEMK